MLAAQYLNAILKTRIGASLRVFCFVAMAGFVSANSILAQDRKPVLVDEMGEIGCDDFLARVDRFYVDLNLNLTTQGFIIISGERKHLPTEVGYELMWDGAIKQRKFDPTRVKKVRGKESGDFNIQFWSVPAGAEQPQFERAEWDFRFSPKSKPILVHSDMEQICSSPTFARALKEYLNANPRSHGKVEIFARSRKAYARMVKDAKANLKGIRSNRLIFVYTHNSTQYPYADYWFVP